LPATYVNTQYVAATVITGPIASPSSPSVRFTAFEHPTITSIANGMYSQVCRLGCTFFRNGTVRCVSKPRYRNSHAAAMNAHENDQTNFAGPLSPRPLPRVSLKESSRWPAAMSPPASRPRSADRPSWECRLFSDAPAERLRESSDRSAARGIDRSESVPEPTTARELSGLRAPNAVSRT